MSKMLTKEILKGHGRWKAQSGGVKERESLNCSFNIT
jgi:hypothetical protein